MKFVVELELPVGARAAAAIEYINASVRAWRGSLFPGDEFDEPDPLWDLDPDTVKVTRYRHYRRYRKGAKKI